MTIQACPRCGSTKLQVPKFKDGVVPEIDNLGDWVCEECDLRAIPLEFEDRSDYETFRDGLSTRR